MELQFLIQVSSTVLVAAVGWLIVHALNSERDAKNKRKDTRLKYMVELYRKLDKGISVGIGSQEFADEVSAAISDLQLFGDQRQVQVARDIARSLTGVHEKSIDISALLLELCNAIRKDLQLPPLQEPTTHLTLKYYPREAKKEDDG